MGWNIEQAVNDLERYVLRGERPAKEAASLIVGVLKNGGSACSGCANGGPMNWCEECMFSHANCFEMEVD